MKCPKCNGAKHVFEKGKGWVKCSCFYESKAQRLMRMGNFPEVLVNLKLSDIELNTQNLKICAAGMVKWVKESRDLVFIHSTTFLKDKMAAMFAKSLVNTYPEVDSVLYMPLGILGEDYFKQDGKIKEATDASVLVLDLGDELTNSVHKNILYSLLKQRVLNNRWTIIISSEPSSKLVSLYSKKVDEIIPKDRRYNL